MASYGVKNDTKMHVYGLHEGTSKKGVDWQFFTYNERRRNENGQWMTVGTYTIFVNNPQKLEDGDMVKVTKITNVKFEKQFYQGREYQKVIVNCDVEKMDVSKNSNDSADFDIDAVLGTDDYF